VIVVVVGTTCSPNAEPWIRLDRRPETFLGVIFALSMVHPLFQYGFANYPGKTSKLAGRWCAGILILLSFIGVFFIAGKEDFYLDKLSQLWSGEPEGQWLEIRQTIEVCRKCSGWDDAGQGASTCKSRIGPEVSFVTARYTIQIIVLCVSQVVVTAATLWIQHRVLAYEAIMEHPLLSGLEDNNPESAIETYTDPA
jgi:hypothetical protein